MAELLDTLPEMKATSLIDFNGQTHLVYTLNDTQFISMRPLVDQIGIDWRWQKKGFLEDESVLFYGTLLLESGEIVQPPCKFGLKNGLFPKLASEKPQKIAVFCTTDVVKDTVFIRLTHVQMYMARISIGQVRAQGNVSAAEWLWMKHEEWAFALHDYENRVQPANKSRVNLQKSREDSYARIGSLIRIKNRTSDEIDRRLLTGMVKDLAQRTGVHYPEQADWTDED